MVTVRVPASTSNLGSGFDTFGLALKFYLTVKADFSKTAPIIQYKGGDLNSISIDDTNLVSRSAKTLFTKIGREPVPLDMTINNPIPLARGLGSSGAATIAGLVAANELLGRPLSGNDLLQTATDVEGHPENVSASFLGGLTISCLRGTENITRKIEIEHGLKAVLAIPDASVSTYQARKVLPAKISHQEAVFNVQRSALLSYAFLKGDFSIMREAMLDKLHQPYRKKLVPDYDLYEKTGYEAGALGVFISGSGSTIIAFTQESSLQIEKIWQEVALTTKIPARIMPLEISNGGVKVYKNDTASGISGTQN